MRRLHLFFSLLLPLGFAALLLCFPAESAAAAREGLALCTRLIIPSLFPFFVISSLLVALGFADALGRLLGGVMRPLFRLPPVCATPLALGALGGYPLGARLTAQLQAEGACTREEATRLSAFCNNCGPAFLFSVAGWGIFGSRAAGALLFATHLLAALIVGVCFRGSSSGKAGAAPAARHSEHPKLAAAFPDCVRDSFMASLQVCAFVVFFSVLLRLLDCTGLLAKLAGLLTALLPDATGEQLARALLAGVLELSCGIATLEGAGAQALALPLAAFLLGWGGLSVHCQSLAYWKSCTLSLRPYFLGKLLQGLLAALLCALLAPHLLGSAQAMLLPAQGLAALGPLPPLLRNEALALWLLAALYCLLTLQKRLVKRLRLQYNKGN